MDVVVDDVEDNNGILVSPFTTEHVEGGTLDAGVDSCVEASWIERV